MIILFDCEGVTITNQTTHELTKVAWIVYDEINHVIVKESSYDLKYNLFRYEKDKWINTYRWIKRNMPEILKDNSPKSADGISLVKARNYLHKDYIAFNCTGAYAKGLSSIDTTFTSNSGVIKTHDLCDLISINSNAKIHNPIEELRFYLTFFQNVNRTSQYATVPFSQASESFSNCM